MSSVMRLRSRLRTPRPWAGTRETEMSIIAENAKRGLEAARWLCIYIYSHVKSRQVVYSLTQNMKNSKALQQLPFVGKQTKPAQLRKDAWRPLAVVKFPSYYQREIAYKQLREFRKRHELEWPLELRIGEDGKPLTKKKLGKRIADQRANTVADLAAVLLRHSFKVRRDAKEAAAQEEESARKKEQEAERVTTRFATVLAEIKAEKANCTEGITERYKVLKTEKISLRKQILNGPPPKRTIGRKGRRKRLAIPPTPTTFVDKFQIEWSDIQDKDYAKKWPESVQHLETAQEIKDKFPGKMMEYAEDISHLKDNIEALESDIDKIKKRHEMGIRQARVDLARARKKDVDLQDTQEALQEAIAMQDEELEGKWSELDEEQDELSKVLHEQKKWISAMQILKQARHNIPPVFSEPLLQREVLDLDIDAGKTEIVKLVDQDAQPPTEKIETIERSESSEKRGLFVGMQKLVPKLVTRLRDGRN